MQLQEKEYFMKFIEEKGALIFFPEGHIDSNNASSFEKELMQALNDHPGREPVLDAEKLKYISSAGLRVLLRLRQNYDREILVRNVSPEVYNIFDITGFTSMMRVEKALRFVSVKGLEIIGTGAHSTVYRLDEESILKVVHNMSLAAIRAEMQTSKNALIHGIPTAISYDVVRTEEGYGEIYEMFHAGVLPAAVMDEPERIEEFTRRFAQMYRAIHTVEIKEGELENARERYLAAADQAAPYLSEEEYGQLRKIRLTIPERHTFIHGDFHMGNVMLQDDELVLIDVGEASWGHPLLDFAQTALAYNDLTTIHAERCRKVLGMDLEQAVYVRDHLFQMYFNETGEALERKMTVVRAMGALRLVLIFFLQGYAELPKDYPDILDRARVNLFRHTDELCELIKSEF